MIGPEILNSVPPKPKEFKLQQHTSPTSFKSLAFMPLANTLRKLEYIRLRSLKEKIYRCFTKIYPYSTVRKLEEGAESFFISIVASAHYEIEMKCNIKDKNHRKKIEEVISHVRTTLTFILEELNNRDCPAEDKAILALFTKILYVHLNAAFKALQKAALTEPDLAEYFLKQYGIDILGYKPFPLSEADLAEVRACYPPDSETGVTPKKYTDHTKRSAEVITPPSAKPGVRSTRRRLFISSEDDNEQASVEAVAALGEYLTIEDSEEDTPPAQSLKSKEKPDLLFGFSPFNPTNPYGSFSTGVELDFDHVEETSNDEDKEEEDNQDMDSGLVSFGLPPR